MKRMNTWYKGWSGYYMMTQYPFQLRNIEAHIRRRLRSRFVDQQKKRRHLFKKLIKRGVFYGLASTVFSNNGRWVTSNTFALTKAYTVEWFIDHAGQWIRSNHRMRDWFPHFVNGLQLHEEPCTDQYARFCGQKGASAPSDPMYDFKCSLTWRKKMAGIKESDLLGLEI